MLLFSTPLRSLAVTLGEAEPRPLISQWLASLLLGALNIEQSKFLNHEDLRLLLGGGKKSLSLQRHGLRELATPATITALLRWNFQRLDPAVQAGTDFYLDPHTQHYTGMQSVLKGWCAAIRWADKLINSDYVHTAGGEPVYFECTDSFEDLRARFLPLTARLRTTLAWEPGRILTMVVDRGIFGNELFEKVAADPALHLITWEKGYVPVPWDPAASHGTCTLHKPRNRADDLRHYHFAWKDQPWEKNPSLRQIVVAATNPNGVTVQLALLTDSPTRPVPELIGLMFNRWIQENDFKYLDKHFGINQLTTYRSTAYAQLREGLTDRLVTSHLWAARHKEAQAIFRKKHLLLAAADKALREETSRQQRIAELEKTLLPPPPPPTATAVPESALTESASASEASEKTSTGPPQPAAGHDRASLERALTKHRQASRRAEKSRQRREKKTDQIHATLTAKLAERDALTKEVSRLDQLTAAGMVRMETAGKTLMDTLRLIARNLFYAALSPFRRAYDNYRDDHGHFREITRSGGVLHWTGEEMEVHLVPPVNHPPKLRLLISDYLRQLNDQHPEMSDGSGRRLKFHLSSREELEVKLKPRPTPPPAEISPA